MSNSNLLDEQLRHSTPLGEISIDLESRPLKCNFPTIEHYEYLLANEPNLVIIAARPGHGKTALACQLGLNASENGKVVFFSLEMDKESLKKRLLAVTSGVPIKKLKEPIFSDRVKAAMEKQKSLNFHIVDEDGLSCDDIISKTFDEYSREKLSLVIIDYVGLIRVNNERRNLSIAEVAKRFKKEISEKLNIPVILLAQMKRGFEERYAKAKLEYEKAKQYPTGANEKILDIRPSMEDLGESSGLEHAANVVMFLFRPCLVDPSRQPSLFKVFVTKNRTGEVKDFDLEFSAALTKFIDNGVV